MHRLGWLALLALLLSSCNVSPLVVTRTMPTATPTATSLVRPTRTMAPTSTRMPPSATRTSSPTATPFPTATATQTPSPTATQVPIVVRITPTLTALDEEARGKLFDEVWQIVADHYLYADFRGVDWEAQRTIFRPRALAAATPKSFYQVLEAMINALGDDHSRFVSPQAAEEEIAIADGTEAYVGVGLLFERDERGAVVTTVFPDGPAADAGLQRRDHLLEIDGKPWASHGYTLRGPEGSIVTLLVETPDEAPREVRVTRRALNARYVPEAYRLPNTAVGYLIIQSLWAESMDEDVVAALKQLEAEGPLDGLIIDLRGNGGGWRTVLEGVLQNFVEGKVGAWWTQDESSPLSVKRNDVYPLVQKVPLVVLVDDATESYAEVLAASLQASGRAQVVGVATAGNTETLYAYDFADKSRLWLAQEGFQLPDGTNLESRGVLPDEVVDVDWLQYSEADDPQIKRAVELVVSGQ